MKKYFYLLLLCLLCFSCEEYQKKIFTVQVTFTDGTTQEYSVLHEVFSDGRIIHKVHMREVVFMD